MGLFQICLEAEKVPLTVQTYREKLRLLQKLSFDVVSYQIPIGPFDLVRFTLCVCVCVCLYMCLCVMS